MLGLPDGVEISGSDLIVKINRASGTADGQAGTNTEAAALNWKTALNLNNTEDDTLTFFEGTVNETDLAYTGDLPRIAAKLNINAYDVLEANAAFDMSSRTVDVDYDDTAGADLEDARLLLLNLELIDPDKVSDDLNGPKRGLVVGTSEFGFAVDSGSLTYALVKADGQTIKPADFDRTYSALIANVNGLTLNGLPEEILIEAHTLNFESNSATGTSPVSPAALDWNKMIGQVSEETFTASPITTGGLNILTNPSLSISGTLTLDLDGFVLGSGSFSFDQKRDQSVSEGINLSVAEHALATFTSGTGVLEVTGTSGAYVLTDGSDYVALPRDASAGRIQSALEGFAGIVSGNVTVTAVADQAGQFTIAPVGTFSLPGNLKVAVNAGAEIPDGTGVLNVTGTSDA